MPLDFKKTERQLYNTGAKPTVVSIPAMTFITTAGKGDPNGSEFADATFDTLDKFIKGSGYTYDAASETTKGITRRHREIYFSDPRKSVSEKMKTIIRYPIKKA